ncbi:MAG: hypothetical protein JSS49_02200 [Planctomycetes bacterium]|nr:hypothetical protein [Planctomycetota bacterium]
MPTQVVPVRLTSIVRSCSWVACYAIFTAVGLAAEPEVVSRHTREFKVSVDGRVRGTQTMTFSRRSDGSEIMQGETEVVLNFVVYRYRYASTGKEIWKDGRLIQLANESDYNGDKYVIHGSATKQALHYEVNGESQQAPGDIWAASYWREPDPRRVGKKVRLLDSDKGRQLIATLEKREPETITVESTPIKASHYNLDGDVEVDVWYDKQGFIVRQESVESGHKTLLELAKIQRSEETAAKPGATLK